MGDVINVELMNTQTMYVPMSTPEDGTDDYIFMAVKGNKIVTCHNDGKSLMFHHFREMNVKNHEDLVTEIYKKSNNLKKSIGKTITNGDIVMANGGDVNTVFPYMAELGPVDYSFWDAWWNMPYEDKRITREEIIANEKYHTCGRCKWEKDPSICQQCKWGEDIRKDLWQLKEESEGK